MIGNLENLKLKYYKLKNNAKGRKKGDIRTFVGVRTWFHEMNLLNNNGTDKYKAHIEALKLSLNELEKSLENGSFDCFFNKSINCWINRKKYISKKGNGKPILKLPIPKIKDVKKNGLNIISLFSGALGLDLGFLAAGFNLRLTNDICRMSKATINKNMPGVTFLLNDIQEVSANKILKSAGLKFSEVDILTGGPPCQPFSTAGKRKALNDPRSSPLKEFIRVVKEIQPRAFVMEEVTGILSSRLKHIPIKERNKDRTLKPEEEKGTVFKTVLSMLDSTGYNYIYSIMNAADFGAPQIRKRVIFIGLRDGIPSFPQKTHSDHCEQTLFEKKTSIWNSFWESTVDLQGNEKNNEFLKISKSLENYMKFIPPGGHWRHLPKDIIKEAMGGAYFSGGGKMGFFRRLSWDEPSPTIVTTPAQKGTLLFHPEEMRLLSIAEYKRVQGFPDDWIILGNLNDKYRLIGDAVPVYLSYSIARKVASLLKRD